MAQESLIQELRRRGLFVATAESLTGGMLGERITNTAGSSDVYLGGVVAYQNLVKEQLLGVSAALLANQGAVDAEVVAQMASGVRAKFARATAKDAGRVIGIATTGVAGPGEAEGKPAGTVFVGISSASGESVYAFEFSGDRQAIRTQSVAAALDALKEQMQLIGG